MLLLFGFTLTAKTQKINRLFENSFEVKPDNADKA